MIGLQNNVLRAGASVWSDGPASGRLVIYSADRRVEQPFDVSGGAAPEISAPIPAYAPDVRIGVVADSGRIYAGAIWARGLGLEGNLIANGDLARPALRAGSPLQPALRYLRAADLLWLLQSERLRWGLPLAAWAGWLFDSFWGHFGWFNVAFVHGSPWAPAIGAVCAAGLAGALVALAAARGGRRAQITALLALALTALVPLALNALIDYLPIQQGRYLFPALPAIALLLALGHETLVPPRARAAWLVAWLCFWLALAAAALVHLGRHYYAP